MAKEEKKEEKKTSGIVRVEVTCEGSRPVLMDRMPREVLVDVLLHGKRPPAKKDREPVDIAREKIYRADGSGSAIGIPMENLFAALKNAGRHVRYDARRAITGGNGSMLPSILQLEAPDPSSPDFLPFAGLTKDGPDKEGWDVDVRQGRQGVQEVAVCVVRPMFRKWTFKVIAQIDLDQLSEETYKKLFSEAGVKSGLGSMRPQKGGNFGMFKVIDWNHLS